MSERPIATEDLRQIEYLLKNNRKIAAIKLYRQATGAELTDSVQAIDRILRTLPEGDSGQQAPISSKPIEPSGCGVPVLLLALVPAFLLLLEQIS